MSFSSQIRPMFHWSPPPSPQLTVILATRTNHVKGLRAIITTEYQLHLPPSPKGRTEHLEYHPPHRRSQAPLLPNQHTIHRIHKATTTTGGSPARRYSSHKSSPRHLKRTTDPQQIRLIKRHLGAPNKRCCSPPRAGRPEQSSSTMPTRPRRSAARRGAGGSTRPMTVAPPVRWSAAGSDRDQRSGRRQTGERCCRGGAQTG